MAIVVCGPFRSWVVAEPHQRDAVVSSQISSPTHGGPPGLIMENNRSASQTLSRSGRAESCNWLPTTRRTWAGSARGSKPNTLSVPSSGRRKP